MIGHTLGPYRIDSKLGEGGMGVVYRAYDTRLERPVAVKLLHERTPGDGGQRLLREARHACRVNHPGVCTVHEIAQHDDRTFIVMELVPGRPLSDVICSGGLPLDSLLDYALQIVSAVAHAHESGVLHRDLKSGNVMVTPDGRTKVMDFGLAEVLVPAPEAATQSLQSDAGGGSVRGTLAYMPPELFRGDPADVRSDVWSLGVLLYEMAAGVRPFAGGTPFAVSSAIMTAIPPPLGRHVPPQLAALITKALAKNPRQRYDSARAMLAVLESLRSPLPAAATAPDARSIAVLPFTDLARAPDDEHLGLGLADALITELAALRSLVVRPTSAIVRYRDTADPRVAGRELGVDLVVEGNFQRVGSRLRLTVQLSDVADGRSLWGTRLTTSFDDLFALQDDVARQLAAALRLELAPVDERERPAQPVAEAYEHYLRGRVRLLAESHADALAAVAAFERATAIDPRFATAFAALADACLRVEFSWEPDAGWYERAEEASARALQLDPHAPEGAHARARLLWTPRQGFQHAAAIRLLLAAVANRPNLNEGHHWLAVILLHVGLLREADAHFQRALAIAPDDLVAEVHSGFCSYLGGDYETAARTSADVIRKDPGTHWAHYQLAMARIHRGDLDAAEDGAAVWKQLIPRDVLLNPVGGVLAALRGDAAEARRLIAATIAARRSFGHYHHAQYDIACIHALLGDREAALEWLAHAGRNGFPCTAFFRRDQLLAPLHGDPRFDALIEELDADPNECAALYRGLTA